MAERRPSGYPKLKNYKLHVISAKGTDELQIVRIMAAHIISFVFVLIIHYYNNRKGRKKPKNQS